MICTLGWNHCPEIPKLRYSSVGVGRYWVLKLRLCKSDLGRRQTVVGYVETTKKCWAVAIEGILVRSLNLAERQGAVIIRQMRRGARSP